MREKGKLAPNERQIIQALKDRNPLKNGRHTRSQFPFLAFDVVLYIANGEMTVELPSLDVAIVGQGITYQELFSQFGIELDEIVNDSYGFQQKRMSD